MFLIISNLILALGLASPIAGPLPVHGSPQEASPSPAEQREEKDSAKENIAPLPYKLGHTYHYAWVIEGEEVGKTALTAATVREQNGTESLLVRGRFDFDRAGRKLSGNSRLYFAAADPSTPVRFSGELNAEAPPHGSQEEKISVRFREGRAKITLDSGQDELLTETVPYTSPLLILESQCFEHWALIAPRFAELQGTLRVFVPADRGSRDYQLALAGEESGKKGVRQRWKVTHPAQEALIWTDKAGILVEYHQGPLQILLSSVEAPKESKSDREKAGESGKGNQGKR